jgi:hypothetical protein
MFIITLIIGLAALTMGRRIYWFFVAVAGFILGMSLGTIIFHGQPEILVLGLALFLGVLGAILSRWMQRWALIIAGFLAGGYITLFCLRMIFVFPQQLSWLPYLIGGLVGAVMINTIFDWALIIISSSAGAALVVEALGMKPEAALPLFVLLLVMGLVVQGVELFGQRRHPTG